MNNVQSQLGKTRAKEGNLVPSLDLQPHASVRFKSISFTRYLIRNGIPQKKSTGNSRFRGLGLERKTYDPCRSAEPSTEVLRQIQTLGNCCASDQGEQGCVLAYHMIDIPTETK